MEEQKDNKQYPAITQGQPVRGGGSNNKTNQGGVFTQHSPSTSGQPGHGIQSEQKNQGNQKFGYVLRKAEKLTTALYLVTDIMSEKEPMKWKIRESGVELLSDITIASSLSASEKMTMLRNAMKKTEKVIAFLDVAQSARLMSEMNSSMLKKEYVALKDSIEGEWEHVYEKSKSIFSDSYFDIPRELSIGTANQRTHDPEKHVTTVGYENLSGQSLPPQSTQPATNRDFFAPKSTSQPFVHQTVRPVLDRSQQSVVIDKKIPTTEHHLPLNTVTRQPAASPLPQQPATAQSSSTPSQEMFSGVRIDANRDDRRKIVLALIKQKPALTVKDIAKSIPHVSEKTIQRELLSMVAENVLVKRGERRWSTYSLRQ